MTAKKPPAARPRAARAQRRATTVVFLVGFMGAGKTAVGRALGRRLRWKFYDLDRMVELHERRSIAEIFRRSGESAFRKAETSALRCLVPNLAAGGGAVVALGGGTLSRKSNVRMMAKIRGRAVFLDAPADELRRRCRAAGGSRPLLVDEQRFRTLYRKRRPQYLAADLRLCTAGKSVVQVAQEIQGWLQAAFKQGRTSRR